MKKALLMCLLLALSAVPLVAAENTYAVGVGFVANDVDVDGGGEFDGLGGFGIFRALNRDGAMLFTSLSFSEGDQTVDAGLGSIDVDDSFLRLEIGGGFMFLRDNVVRPFVHAGLAYLVADEKVNGIVVVDDSSFSVSLGFGLEAGTGPHAFYSNLSYDLGHDVETNTAVSGFDLIGRSEFALLELQLGYIYSF